MTDPTPTSGPRRDRRETLRLVAGIIVILAFIALATIAIAASRSDFSLTAPASASEGEPIVSAVPEAPSTTPVTVPIPMRVVPISTTADTTPPAPVADDPGATPDLPPPPALDESDEGKPCKQFGLPAPDKVGGLQSLVRLIPLFGKFSPEAFTMVPAFQPGIDTLGPLFPVFEQLLDAGAPVLDPLVPVASQLVDAGFDVVAPLYGPVRPQVLSGEAQLAAYLQPIIQSLADTPGSECMVALEGLLASIVPNTGLVPDLP